MELIKNVILQLGEKGTLSNTNNPHKLSGDYSTYWEAHIKPDWLIIWKPIIHEQEIWLGVVAI